MGRRGTKPLPIPLKILKGTQPCRVNLNEPAATMGVPEKPEYLDPLAVDFWDEVAPVLVGMGVLALSDKHALGFLCDSYSRWRVFPEVQSRRNEYRKLLAEFGLTPSSRSGLKVEPVKPRNKLDDLMAKK